MQAGYAMADRNAVSPVTIDELKVILGEIASLAQRGDAMYFHFWDSGADRDEAETLHNSMRNLIGRMGMLADLGLGKVGDAPVKERLEEWLLPPSYRWPNEEHQKLNHDRESVQ